MKITGRIIKYSFAIIFILASFSQSQAQYFGQNRIKNKRLDFSVAQTPNFEIYHYLQNDEVLRKLINDTERWYQMHQIVLKDTFNTLNPVIFYNNHADFQQTNTIFGDIGVGTGGVTEGLKNRVVMPINESNHQTDHVLGHELVHAFQYHLLRTGDSTSLNSIRNLPLWMVEGMAEYMSIGYLDSHTAMWMRDSYQNDDLPTLEQLTTSGKYFPYRYGQAFWAYVTGIWGDQIIEPLFTTTAKYGYEKAIPMVLGYEADVLSNMWRTSLKEFYGDFWEGIDTVAAGKNILNAGNSGTMNISPAISPNGKMVAFLSEKSIFSIDLFLANAETGEVIKKLYSTSRNGHIDDLNFLESAGTWSPNSDQFAFTAFSGGKNKLIVVDANRPNKTETYDLEGLDAFSNPAWSPDAKQIAVTGLVNGQSDIFLFDITTQRVKQITNDKYSYLQPNWSPDGNQLIMATERNQNGTSSRGYNILIYDLNTGNDNFIDIFQGAENLNPIFAPDGNSIYFLSNRDGFRNLYNYNLDTEELNQLTRYFTGISGITALSPAVSIARDENKLSYSHFNNGQYTIYTAQPDDFVYQIVDPKDVTFDAAILPPSLRMGRDLVVTNLKQPQLFSIPTDDQIEHIPYEKRFKLDHISQQAGAGISTNRLGGGLAGGVNMIFSDMLGDNQLFGGFAVNGEVYDFGGQIAFVNQKNKVNWGASVSHIPYPAYRTYWQQDTIRVNGDTLQVMNLAQEVWRTFQDRAAAFAYFPISKSLRFEAGASFSRYSYRRDKFNNYFLDGNRVLQDREKLPAPDGFNLQQVDLAYVGDNSQFGIASPMNGFRHRFQVEKYFGGLDFYSLLVDYRRYFWVDPFNISFRALHQNRIGNDAANGILPPFAVFYPTLVRGYGWNNLYMLEQGESGFNTDDLLGSKMLVGNIEIRIPFTGPERLTPIKSKFLFSELTLFLDGGMAWGNWNNENQFEQSVFSQSSSFGKRKPIFSTGVAMRVNVFNAMILEPFYAIPLQGKGMSRGSFGLNFTPGW